MTLNADNVADYAETLVLQVKGADRELDYSTESIGTVEELLRISDELLRGEGFPDAQRNLIVFYNGCYIGEVLSRHFGGTWQFAENWYDSSLIFPYGEGGLQVFPFQKVYRRITEDPAENDLAAYVTGLREKLAAEPA